MTLGSRIRAARRAAGLSQMELASRLGVSQAAISAWERGAVEDGPRLSDGVRIAALCDVELLWLATGLGEGPASEAA